MKKNQEEFEQMREKMQEQKLKYKLRIKYENECFKKNISKEIEEFKDQLKKTTVSRKRDIQTLFAAKCRVTHSNNAPSESEVIKALIGDQSMIKGNLQETTKSILKKKGIIQPQSIQEKYQKVFDKYTLSPEELDTKIEGMIRRNTKMPKKEELKELFSGDIGSHKSKEERETSMDELQNLPLDMSIQNSSVPDAEGLNNGDVILLENSLDPNAIRTERIADLQSQEFDQSKIQGILDSKNEKITMINQRECTTTAALESKMLSGGLQSSDEDRNNPLNAKKAFNALIDHSISFGEEDIAMEPIKDLTMELRVIPSQFEKRLGRFGKFNEQDKERLLQIFIETKDDPEWFAESVFYDLYQKRIPINDFLSLLSSDPLWSHMATSKQVS